jgi:hypothetical protein
VVPVAILSSATFDATTVDLQSVCFGDADTPSERACQEAHKKLYREDVNRDGHVDAVLHFRVKQTGIDKGDTSACLTGRTSQGGPFQGCDAVRVKK